MNIYVGNLAREVTSDDLHQAFAAHGEVTSANIITDKFTGESRGFGFVEMPKNDEARAAMGRTLNVNEARPRNDRSRDSGSRSGGRRSW